MTKAAPARNRQYAFRDRCRAEAKELGLKRGDAHPDTGRIFNGQYWASPDKSDYHTHRVYHVVASAKHRAKKRGLEFDLTTEWMEAAMPADGRCPIMPDIILKWGTPEDKHHSPSIDRIVPELGYVQSNCRIVSNRANILRNNATIEELELVLADARSLHSSAH